MGTNFSVIQQLDKIRNILTHSVVDHDHILKEVRAVFRESRYQKRPIIQRTEAVIRASKKDRQEWFDHVNKFSYPPAEYLETFGRCNKPDEPIFYCSNENAVPVFEIRPSINDYVTLSHWGSGIRGKDIEYYILPLGSKAIIDHLREDDPLRKVLLQDDVFKKETSQSIKDIDDYIGKLFVEDVESYENLYWFTYAVTNAILNLTFYKSGKKLDDKKLDGVMYPSVASKLSGFNLALTKEYVDKNLRLREVTMWKVISIDNTTYEYKLKPVKSLNRPNAKGDNLTWTPIDGDDYFEFSPVTLAKTYDPKEYLSLEK